MKATIIGFQRKDIEYQKEDKTEIIPLAILTLQALLPENLPVGAEVELLAIPQSPLDESIAVKEEKPPTKK